MNNNLKTLEKKERELYFEEYKKCENGTRSAGPISKNFGKIFYDLFKTDLSALTEQAFHFQRVQNSEYIDLKTNKQKLPKNIQDILNVNEKTILDFGTGNGEFCRDLSKNYENTNMTGVDLATVDLGITNKHSTDNCKFVSSGAETLPFSDKSFDIVTSFLVLEHVHYENIDNLFSEFKRVAKKGFIFQISHGSINKNNMRRISEGLLWWQNKLSNLSENLYLYYPSTDNYKWGIAPNNLGMSRWICEGVKK